MSFFDDAFADRAPADETSSDPYSARRSSYQPSSYNVAELTADMPVVRGDADGGFPPPSPNGVGYGAPPGFEAARPNRFAPASQTPPSPSPPPQNGFVGGGFESARPARFAPVSQTPPAPVSQTAPAPSPPPQNGFVGGGFESARPARFAPVSQTPPAPHPPGPPPNGAVSVDGFEGAQPTRFVPASPDRLPPPTPNGVAPSDDGFGPATQVSFHGSSPAFPGPPPDDFGAATQIGRGSFSAEPMATTYGPAAPVADDGFGAPTVHGFGSAAPTVNGFGSAASVADDGFGAPTVHDLSAPAFDNVAATTVHDFAPATVHGFAAPPVTDLAATTVHDFAAPSVHDLGAVPQLGYESSTQQIPSMRFIDEHDFFNARQDEPLEEDIRPARRSRERPQSAARLGPGKTLRRAATAAAAFTLALVVSSASVAGLAYQKYNRQLNRVSVLQTHDPSVREAARQQNAENFLMIGSDSRAGANSAFGNVAGARSDTTILVHLSPDHTKATVISIPRDSWVDIPACKQADGSVLPEHHEMFNSAFADGGPACTIKTVQKLTGILVTHFVEIDFSGFEKMVNALGSVRICSPQTVNDPMSGLHLKQGVNKLHGAQALAYVRARESLGDGSDLGRIKRQQMFLGAVLRQAMNGKLLSSPTRLNNFLDAATKAITVDKGTSFQDLRTLATSMQGLDPRRVKFYTAPIADANYTPPGTTMTGRVLLDPVAGRALYDSVINDKKPVWVKKVNGKTVVTSPKPATTGSGSSGSGTSRGGTAATSPSQGSSASAPAGTSSIPAANGTAAQRTCSL